MHIKSSNNGQSNKVNASAEVKSENSSSPSENMQNSSNEDDAGGGTFIFYIFQAKIHETLGVRIVSKIEIVK